MIQTKQRLVFIVGVGRSGTSLLQSMLHSHPEVSFPPEFNFIRRFLATNDLEKMWARDRAMVAERLSSDDLISRLGLGEERIREILSSLGDRFSSRELYLQLLKDSAGEEIGDISDISGIKWLGDKDPRSVEYLPVLHHHFPEARILHIIRDPRDVLSSKKKAEWSKNRSPLQHVFANRVQLKMGRESGRELFGPAHLEFAYEELLRNPEGVLTRICRFLEIDFDPSMLDYSESSKIFVSDEEMQWKKETLGPLLAKNVGKWKGSLTPWEAALTERVCGEAFSAMHYKKSTSATKLGIVHRLALVLTAMLLVGLDPLYRFYRKREERVSERFHT